MVCRRAGGRQTGSPWAPPADAGRAAPRPLVPICSTSGRALAHARVALLREVLVRLGVGEDVREGAEVAKDLAAPAAPHARRKCMGSAATCLKSRAHACPLWIGSAARCLKSRAHACLLCPLVRCLGSGCAGAPSAGRSSPAGHPSRGLGPPPFPAALTV